MNRQVFLFLAIAVCVSFFSISESINTKIFEKGIQNGQKRPNKKGVTPLSNKMKDFYKKASVPKKSGTSHRQGLNYDVCETDYDCQGTRVCSGYDAQGDVGNCGISFPDECRCLEEDPFCSSSSDCSVGENCASELVPDYEICVSNQVFQDDQYSGTEPSTETAELSSKPGSNGVALDYCTTDYDCQEGLKCYTFDSEGFYVNCDLATGNECFCDYDFENGSYGECTSESDCLSGEGCDEFDGSGFCISDTAFQGYNLDFCFSSLDCRGARECLSASAIMSGSLAPCSTSDTQCVCLQENILCTDSYDCAYWGESCYSNGGTSLCVSDAALSQLRAKKMSSAITRLTSVVGPSPASTFEAEAGESAPQNSSATDSSSSDSEISATQAQPGNFENDDAIADSPNPSTASEKVCIAVHSLAHLKAHELLYETHRTARVLCDNHNSCATAGHIVQYQGTPMMMKNYCALVGCKMEIMNVNSPRYKRGMQLPSMTKDLSFTTFAARYETSTEEKLLATAVRFGL
ncbi:unnamed protein product [Agarophyton chilense]